jgi:hypothetical protein
MSDLKNLIKKTLLKEEKFMSVQQSITFDFDVYYDAGGHAKSRMLRHGKKDRITEYYVHMIIKKGLDDIIYNILDNNIRHGVRFILSQNFGDYINLVLLPQQLDATHWNLTIITMIKTDSFTIGHNQLQIFVEK